MTSTAAAPDRAAEPDPSFPAAPVEEMLRSFVKAVRAHQLYLPNNPMHHRAIDAVRAGFAPIWAQCDEFTLLVAETEFRGGGRAVLSESEKTSENLAWLFYKDGIRELRFLRGFEQDELVKLLDIIQRLRKTSPDEDDLLTMLWEQEFVNLRYRYVDLSVDTTAPVEGTPSEERPQHVDVVEEEEQSAPRHSGVVSMADFDSTLYFLDEREIEYLHEAVRHEYASDLRRTVLATLLDIFEAQAEPSVRDEVCGILDNFLVHLLSAGNFRSVAYLLREAGESAARARALEPQHRERIATLPDRLSEPAALSQLLQSLDEATELPPQDELTELLGELRPTAMGTVFAWLGRVQSQQLRALLETAGARLSSANTAELVRLIGGSDATVSIEAIRHAARLKTPAAVAPLSKVLGDGQTPARLAAVNALSEIGSPGALQALERAVGDSERDVRVAALRALAARTYRPALARIEGVIKSKGAKDANLTEKMALFELYGSICGDGGISLLEGLLTSRSLLGRREEPETRACAAMALGRIASPAAIAVLQKAAANEKEVLVRNAVNQALRGGKGA